MGAHCKTSLAKAKLNAAQKMLNAGYAVLLGDAAGCTAQLQDELGCAEAHYLKQAA